MGVLRSAIFFSAGAAAYPLLELVWRGRTHPSMALAGGLGLCALDALSTSPPPTVLEMRRRRRGHHSY